MPRNTERRLPGEGSVTWDESVQRWIGRLPRDERGRRAKVSGRTRREAERKLDRKLTEYAQGVTGAGRTTVAEFLNQWVRDTLSVSGLDERTIGNYERMVRLHLVPAIGRIQLARLTPAHVQRFIRDELDDKSPSTVHRSLTVLRRALSQAVLWGLVPRNVAKLVDGVTVRRSERRPFTLSEQAAILTAAHGDRLYVMVVLAHATGLRQSELLGLRWPDVDAHRSWTRILARAGVEHRGIHHMRHTYGTTLAERGVHERVAQYLLGHADSRMTKEIYTHVPGGMLDHAASAIDGAVTDVAREAGFSGGSKDQR